MVSLCIATHAPAAVESRWQLLVGRTVTPAANDQEQRLPLVEAVEQQSGQRPAEVLADSGDCAEKNLASWEAPEKPAQKSDASSATKKQQHGQRAAPAPRGPLPRAATRVERMQRQRRTKAGAKIYAQRQGIVEPICGQIKQARGMRPFLLRGLKKALGEWALLCLTHNLLKRHTLCLWIGTRKGATAGPILRSQNSSLQSGQPVFAAQRPASLPLQLFADLSTRISRLT